MLSLVVDNICELYAPYIFECFVFRLRVELVWVNQLKTIFDNSIQTECARLTRFGIDLLNKFNDCKNIEYKTVTSSVWNLFVGILVDVLPKMYLEILIAFAVLIVVNCSCDCGNLIYYSSTSPRWIDANVVFSLDSQNIELMKFVIIHFTLACGLKGNPIVGDNNTQPDDKPWIVGVFYDLTSPARIFKCSGSLISNEHVLISAECAVSLLSVREKMGRWIEVRIGNDTSGDGASTINRNIWRIYRHENYDDRYFENNIGILQLYEEVAFSDNIQPICLPPSPDVDYNGKLATAMGWYDFSTYAKMYLRAKAQRTHIPIWTNEQCAKVLDYTRKLKDNMICAGDHENGGECWRIADHISMV